MKAFKSLLIVVLILSMSVSLLACEKGVNLQTEKEAVDYLKNYIEEKDKWGHIADELGLYYSVVGSKEFLSSSFAQPDNGGWVVVLHGKIAGYTDYNKSNLASFVFSYTALVTADGKVTEVSVQEGKVTSIHVS